MPENILILGGSGFLGSYLAEFLKPHYAVDVTSTQGGIATLQFDVLKNKFAILDKYECVVNCMVSNQIDDKKNFNVNVKGTRSILEHLQNNRCHYVNISSVFATAENFRQNNYSLTKHLTDEVVRSFEGRPFLKLTTLRFSQIYDAVGKARKTQAGLFYFAEKIKNQETLTLFAVKRPSSSAVRKLRCSNPVG